MNPGIHGQNVSGHGFQSRGKIASSHNYQGLATISIFFDVPAITGSIQAVDRNLESMARSLQAMAGTFESLAGSLQGATGTLESMTGTVQATEKISLKGVGMPLSPRSFD